MLRRAEPALPLRPAQSRPHLAGNAPTMGRALKNRDDVIVDDGDVMAGPDLARGLRRV